MKDTRFGHFNADGSFTVTTPKTPRNWYNYLFNDGYVTCFSQTAFGEGFAQDDLGRRHRHPPPDREGLGRRGRTGDQSSVSRSSSHSRRRRATSWSTLSIARPAWSQMSATSSSVMPDLTRSA